MKRSSKAYYAIGGELHLYHHMPVWNVYSSRDDVLIGEMADFPNKNALVTICGAGCDRRDIFMMYGCTKSGFHLILKKDWIEFVYHIGGPYVSCT